jgi:hypothetical protein
MCCATALVVGLTGVGASAQGHDDTSVLLEDLVSPKGLAVGTSRDLIIAQGAFGPPAPVLSYVLRGRGHGSANEVTDPFNLVDVAISPRDGTGWAIGPGPDGADEDDPATDPADAHLYHQLADGTIVDVLNLFDYQIGDPDPVDHDDPPFPTESNPYGLTVDRHGDALVADAAGNDIVRVTPGGTATTVARFDLEAVETDHLPPDEFPGLPPSLDAEAVPTTVTIGPDGAIYVGELKGFPFRPGTSNVWRISPQADGAWCSKDEPDPSGDCTLYSSGYTAIQDIAFDHQGRLLVYELAADGVLAFEGALGSGGPFPSAVLLRVDRRHRGEQRVELAAGELSQPGGVVVDHGDIYVTDGVFTAGRLLHIDG